MLPNLNEFHESYHSNSKPILLLQIGLAEGRGDWVHGLEIARHIKENFGHIYIVTAFIFPDTTGILGALEAKPYVDKFKKEFLEDEGNSMYKLSKNDFFDYLYDGYALGTAKITELYKDFIQQTPNIHAEIIISYLMSCIIEDRTMETKFNTILMAEYGAGMGYKHLYERNWHNFCIINLAMGFGEKCNGIRIYSNDNEANYWEELKKQNIDLYNKLFINTNNYETYHQSRTLLPGDLRNIWAILNFIKINCIIYGGKCDFYLPKKYLEQEYIDIEWSSVTLRNMIGNTFEREDCDKFNKIFNNQDNYTKEKLQDELSIYCEKYGIPCKDILKPVQEIIRDFCVQHQVDCKFVSPGSSDTEADLTENPNCIRFFLGFELTDDLYKGLYLYNQGASAGISGDDGWSLAISSNNLPFHGNRNVVQSQVFGDFVKLAESLDLQCLKKYLQCFAWYTSINLLIHLEPIITNPSEIKKILKEYSILTEHVKVKLNIFHKLCQHLELLKPQPNTRISL